MLWTLLLGFCAVGMCGLTAPASGQSRGLLVRHLFSFPAPGDSLLQLASPQGLAVDLEGFIYVADTGNNRLVKCDRNGNLIDTVGGFGWESQQFDQPVDMSVHSGLDVFVADFNNERIERYDKDLNFISSFTPEDVLLNSVQFGFPAAVDVSRHGELFICDTENNRILKLNSFGEAVLSFGDFNWGEGQLQYPGKIAISEQDQVYVSDRDAGQIVVFDYYGNYVKRFGEEVLQQPGGFDWWRGRLLVADTGNHRVVVFDDSSQPGFQWGQEGTGAGAFNNPADLAVFDQRIYVLDSGNGRVQVFEVLAQ